MERIAAIYGYSVCLLAIVAIGFAAIGFVNGLFAYERPLTNASWNGASLSSYEAFRATYHSAQIESGAGAGAALPPDDRLQPEYVARRDDAIAGARADALRAVVGDAVLSLVALALFRFHWRWLRRISLASSW
jgi:hypothetical protein